MYIRELQWDDYRIDHIARHDVEPDEVEEVCDDPSHLARRAKGNRYRLYGQTRAGRYLLIVLEQLHGSLYKPITARDMTPDEKHNFRRVRK